MNQKLANYLTPVVALFFATALGVTASSTIGTDISTGGNLDVTGNTTLTGTLGVTGATTLGVLTASTTAAGEDITLKATDEIITSADHYDIRLPADTSYLSVESDLSASNILFDPVGSEEFTVYLDDDATSNSVEFDCTGNNGACEFNSNGAGGYFQVLTSGANSSITLYAGGSGAFTNITAEGAITINSGGGTPVRIYDPLAIPAAATLPTCNTTVAPTNSYALYVDTTGPDLCMCNGTSWAPVDGSGTCS